MIPGDFSFRVSCYEQFHWSPEQVKALPLSEAEKLAIYFSEVGRKQWRDRKDQQSNYASPSSSSDGYHVEKTFGGDSYNFEYEE